MLFLEYKLLNACLRHMLLITELMCSHEWNRRKHHKAALLDEVQVQNQSDSAHQQHIQSAL